jgi:hypothetical protein
MAAIALGLLMGSHAAHAQLVPETPRPDPRLRSEVVQAWYLNELFRRWTRQWLYRPIQTARAPMPDPDAFITIESTDVMLPAPLPLTPAIRIRP